MYNMFLCDVSVLCRRDDRMMGDVRKKLPKELKEDAMAVRNSITFDLIAVNKAARVENKERALEVILSYLEQIMSYR